MRSISFWVIGVWGALGIGCGGSSSGVDAAVSDAAVADAPPDAPVASDGGHPCLTPCGADQACVWGTCVASCGASLLALEGALVEGQTVIANVCRAVAGPLDVVVEGGVVRVVDLATETSGTTTTFTVSRWTLDPAVATPAVSMVASASHTAASGDVLVFPGGFLDVSPDGTRAIFGYTTTDTGSAGGIFVAPLGGGDASELDAPGNFDATWVDADRFLVNGLGLDGEGGTEEGLYLHDLGDGTSARVASDMGAYSGSVEGLATVVVAAGFATMDAPWPDASQGARVFVLDRAALLAAAAPIPAWTMAAARLEGPSSFDVLGGDRLAGPRYDDTFAVEAIEARALASGAGAWTLGEPIDVTRGDAITAVASLPGGRLAMVHAGGVLIVEE